MNNKAKEFFIARKGNCAQSVASAWEIKTGERTSEDFTSCGSGRAPGGLCGALHAACIISGEKSETLKEKFSVFSGGHVKCRDIRLAGKVKCAECVSHAAELLEKHIINERQ